MKKRIKKERDKSEIFFLIIGIFLFIIWVIDLIQKLRLYNQYEYLWFCSISVLLLSIGCIFKSRTFILSFIPIAIEAQIFWIIDYFLIIFKYHTFTNTVNYMFDHGQTFGEFLVGIKHLFIIPLGLLALVLMKKPIKKYYFVITLIIGYAILILSPMIPTSNLNCVSNSCFGNYSGFSLSYYIEYMIITTIIAVSIGFILYKLIKNSDKNIKLKKILIILIIIFFCISIFGSIIGILKYNTINHYHCINEKSNIFCEKTYNKNQTSFYISYDIKDRSDMLCKITAISNEKVIGEREYKVIENPEKGDIYLPISQEDMNIILKENCTKS